MPSASEFPPPSGRNIFTLAKTLVGQVNVGLATSGSIVGSTRLAFGVIGSDNRFVYGPAAIYVATSQSAPLQGPFVAPVDSMRTARRYQSKTVALDSAAIQAIYETRVRLPQPGTYGLLVMFKQGSGFVGGITTSLVRAMDQVPGVGRKPPSIHTPTTASVHGNLASIDTRTPHDDMHRVDFAQVIGRKPVALLFSTPQLCQSRVCGPVTDIALQLEHEFAGRVTLIHNEVYKHNTVSAGLRSQLLSFHLQTEPWLFTFDRRGRIASRLEGAFGIRAFRQAVRAALG